MQIVVTFFLPSPSRRPFLFSPRNVSSPPACMFGNAHPKDPSVLKILRIYFFTEKTTDFIFYYGVFFTTDIVFTRFFWAPIYYGCFCVLSPFFVGWFLFFTTGRVGIYYGFFWGWRPCMHAGPYGWPMVHILVFVGCRSKT